MKKLLSLSIASVLSIAATTSAADDNALRNTAKAMFGTLPTAMPGADKDSAAKIELGKKLYMDTRLSKNDTQSCNSCHNVSEKNGKFGPGVDNQATSAGAFGKNGDRNSPTVWNAGFQLAQFWDGRAEDLTAQAKGPILNPIEMAMPNEKAVLDKLAKTEYPAQFDKVYGKKGMTYQNLAESIAAFERTLITQDRFDDFINGDNKALNAQEKRGLQTFINSGCTACHNGPTLGGKMYQKVGLIKPYANQHDQGRFAVTKNAADKMVFKVPMLRDIARTAPYFHDGKVKTLEEAVALMGELQLGKKLSKQEVSDITAFLNSLTHKAAL